MNASREVVHAYWRAPWDGRNGPQTYTVAAASARSAFFADLLARHVSRDARVLEVGCNAGRNLAHLRRAGYTALSGIDISPAAVDLLRATYPELAGVTVSVGAAEDLLAGMGDGAVDVVCTMAVLEHIHPESEGVFAQMARVARRTIVTIEDEQLTTWRHFPRNYRTVFEGLGLVQVEEVPCRAVQGLGRRFMARVLAR